MKLFCAIALIVSSASAAVLYPFTHPATLKDGFIDANGTIVIPLAYDNVDDFGPSGLTKVCIKHQCSVIDTQGNKRFDLPEGTSWLGKFVSHTAPIKVNGKQGFISDRGEMLEEPGEGADIYNFKAGWAKVVLGSKNPRPYFINPDRNKSIGPFFYATEFDGDTASAAYGQAHIIKSAKKPEVLIIDTHGNVIAKKTYPFKEPRTYHSGYTIVIYNHNRCYYADKMAHRLNMEAFSTSVSLSMKTGWGASMTSGMDGALSAVMVRYSLPKSRLPPNWLHPILCPKIGTIYRCSMQPKVIVSSLPTCKNSSMQAPIR